MTDITTAADRIAAFRPLNGQILVELERAYSDYVGPLTIPDSAAADVNSTRLARVVAVGPGRKVEGSTTARCAMNVKVGDRIILDEIALRGPWPAIAPGFHCCEEEQILGVVEDE